MMSLSKPNGGNMLPLVPNDCPLKKGVFSWIRLKKGNAHFVLSLVLRSTESEGLAVEIDTSMFLLQDLEPFEWLSYEEWKADKSLEEAHREDAHRDYILEQALSQGVLVVSCAPVVGETNDGCRAFQASLGIRSEKKVVRGKIPESVVRRFFEQEVVPAK